MIVNVDDVETVLWRLDRVMMQAETHGSGLFKRQRKGVIYDEKNRNVEHDESERISKSWRTRRMPNFLPICM